MRDARRVLMTALLVACGCGDGSGGPAPDGGAGEHDAGESTPEWLSPPAAASLPTLTPCPDGWRETTASETTVCEPWPETGREECAGAEAHLPGGAGCAPIGRACPAGEFAEDLPTSGTVLYVRAGATGGDGTPDQPFGSIAEAASAAAGAPATIALAKGRYDEPVRLVHGLSLVGACPAETVLTHSASTRLDDPVVHVTGVETGLRDVRIDSPPTVGILLRSPGNLRIDGVVVEGALSVGMLVDGGGVEGRGLVIRDTRSIATGEGGWGLSVERGGSADLADVAIEGSRALGVFAGGAGTSLTLDRAVVRGTRSRTLDGRGGTGLQVSFGASAMLSGVAVEQSQEQAVWASDDGTELRIAGAVIRGTRENDGAGRGGNALAATEGATVEASRCWLDDGREVGVVAMGVETRLTIEDVVVGRNRRAREAEAGGFGMKVSDGAALTGTRVLAHDNTGLGVALDRAGPVRVRDLVVVDTGETDGGFGGGGLYVGFTDSVSVERARIERSRTVGVLAGGEGTSATMSDVVVRETLVAAAGGAPRAIDAEQGASLEVVRALLEGNAVLGAVAFGSGTRLSLEDVAVLDTVASCADASCEVMLESTGIGAFAEGRVQARRFLVRRATLCGVHVARAGQLDLELGEVSESSFGACVQDAGYDVERLSREVVYRDNGMNLSSRELPVPDPAGSPSVGE